MSYTPQDKEFSYNVFLSYRHQELDRAWVRKTLLPRLESDGLRVCIDFRDFRLGEPIILEMSRAVEQSRYTLAVLTPAYLNSNFTELENVMAEHLGLEKSQRRLLIIMREQCSPRLTLRSRLWLDMTDDSDFEININKLISELKQPADK